MASLDPQLTDYERRRLENIKRNGEMMASLKIHSHLSELSAISNPTREKRPYKKHKSETPIVIRQSLRTRGRPPDSSGLPKRFNRSYHLFQGPRTMSDAYQGDDPDSYRPLIENISRIATKYQLDGEMGDLSSDGKRRSSRVRSNSKSNVNAPGHDLPYLTSKVDRIKLEDPIDLESLRLEPQNVVRVMSSRIMVVRFLPTTDMRMVIAANDHGNLGFWNLDKKSEDWNGVYLYRPHSVHISGISMQPFALSKLYTSSHDGLLRLMDIEKEIFDLLYSSNSESELSSIAQQPNNANSIYFGEGEGSLNMFDARTRKISSSWSLHKQRVNTIDFSAVDANIMATSSLDGLACLWDLRKMDVKQPKTNALQIVNHHNRHVHSAYFSPSGSCLATTSLDNSIGVLRGANFEEMFMIQHNNRTDGWQSTFRAAWGWDDTYLYIGNTERRVDVVSVSQRKVVYALDSPLMSAFPSRFDAHPCVVGMLAGSTSDGQVYVWTSSS